MNRSLVALAHFSPRIVAVAAMLPVVLTLTMGVAHGQGAGDDVAAAKAHYARLLEAHPGYTSADYLTAFKHRPDAHVDLIRRAFAELEALPRT